MNSTALGRAAIRGYSPRQALPGEGDIVTGREHVAAYLEPLAASPALAGQIETGTTVLAVGRAGLLKEDLAGDPRRATHPFRLLLRAADGQERVEEADVVIDCTGCYGNGRSLGDGGIPAGGELAAREHIASGLEDVLGERVKHYSDKTVLVVGAGHSAATTVCLLAELAKRHPATWIVWLARAAGSQPIRRVLNDPLRERDLIAARANMLATRGEGHVEFHAQAIVETIEFYGPNDGFVVQARVAGETKSWQVDRLIANVGYGPDLSLARELQVQECSATFAPTGLAATLLKHAGTDSTAIPPPPAAALRTGEPNYYVLGAKSYGRQSNFLMRTGFEQVRDVFTLIAAKPGLDLYAAAR
ncbi:MAG: monooxygenase [Gemmataceae bacterium]